MSREIQHLLHATICYLFFLYNFLLLKKLTVAVASAKYHSNTCKLLRGGLETFSILDMESAYTELGSKRKDEKLEHDK